MGEGWRRKILKRRTGGLEEPFKASYSKTLLCWGKGKMLLKDPARIMPSPIQGKGRERRKGNQNSKEGELEGVEVIRKEWDKEENQY
jgi:hypothetical protein